MASVNRVELLGNVGKAPELRYTAAGKAVTSVSVATDAYWRGADGNREKRTTWTQVTFWGNLAEVCSKWVDRGDRVYITGRMQTRTREVGGVHIQESVVVGDEIQFLTDKTRGEVPPMEVEHGNESEDPSDANVEAF